MTWTTFKERMPELDQPIWVYKPSEGVRAFFKRNDDILPCKVKYIKEYKDGKYYFLEGYSYNRGNSDLISEEKIMPLKWTPIPSPLGSVVPRDCPNCKEPINTECACLRNKCVRCLKPVGNITFTVCDDCWDKEATPQH